MRMGVITATWNRPELLGRMIECFNRQTHEDRLLIILDDTGQYGSHRSGDRWELFSVPRRIHKYAHKLNVLASMLPSDVEGMCVFDDDDVYMPHTLAAYSEALERGQWAQPRVVYEHREGGLVKVNAALANGAGYLYHGTWCYRKKAFDDIGGYQHPPLPFDYLFGQAMARKYGPSVDVASEQYPEPTYIFCRDTSRSADPDWDTYWPLGEVGYERRRRPTPRIAGKTEQSPRTVTRLARVDPANARVESRVANQRVSLAMVGMAITRIVCQDHDWPPATDHA